MMRFMIKICLRYHLESALIELIWKLFLDLGDY